MKELTWLGRLREQLPGWFVWTTGEAPRWRAVPAPPGVTLTAALLLPNRVEAATAVELRAAARLRYGWDDYCESCGLLARECGHRQPEREGSRG